MKTQDTVRDFLLSEVVDPSVRDQLTDHYSIIESGLIDSQGIFRLVAFLEEEFAIEVMDEDLVLENFGTIGRIADYVNARRSEVETDVPAD